MAKLFNLSLNLLKNRQFNIINQRLCSNLVEEVTNEEEQVYHKKYHKDVTRDRRVPIDPEISIKYMKSQAYKDTYQHYLVWHLFRRGFKGQIAPANLRRSCLDEWGFVKMRNACPICRDKYLVFHYTNVDLLKQFISPYTGTTYPLTVTNLCQMQYEKLLLALYQAYDYGTLTFEVPFREYDYKQYYNKLINK